MTVAHAAATAVLTAAFGAAVGPAPARAVPANAGQGEVATPAIARAAPIGAAAAATLPASPRTIQRLALLERGHHVFERPDHRSRQLTTVRRARPITGLQTVLPVLGERTGNDGRQWLQVLLPGRPNGARGWISPRFTRYALTPWSVRVDLSARTATVVNGRRVVRSFRVVVGAASTPTPTGRFFVEETVRLAADRVGAPFALALSARSPVLAQFAGGPGQIALHGLWNVGGVLGTAVSHGCVRVDERNIRWLAATVPAGSPVTIGA
ncbi:MAG TPA: L,D-transpeptidase [Conexibacter sp.]|nr:L,D-transpeptidase [Conexibacter sp.]